MVERIQEPNIELNSKLCEALEYAEHGDKHLLVTGGAGVGKSTFIHLFRSYTQRTLQVVAPTGIAALNVGGLTIHSAFGIKPRENYYPVHNVDEDCPFDPNKAKIAAKSIDTLIIDEVSMVRIDLLQSINLALQHMRNCPGKAFGGVRVILVGDPYQLQPIHNNRDKSVGDYFESIGFARGKHKFFSHSERSDFSFSVYRDCKVIELTEVYRQKGDARYMGVLNRIRKGNWEPNDLPWLNARVQKPNKPVIHIVTENKEADAINEREMAKLDLVEFPGQTFGDVKRVPTITQDIRLGIGMRVVIVANSFNGAYVNGTQGVIRSLEGITWNMRGEQVTGIDVEISKGRVVTVPHHRWETIKTTKDGPVVTSAFHQYPLIPGYAVTVHRAQGQTYHDGAYVDLSRAKQMGHAYVALSRVPSYDSLYLASPITERTILPTKFGRADREIQRIKRFEAVCQNR